jgi:hypothetical protein
MAKKKEIIEIKIDRLKLMRIPGAPPGQLHETKKEKAERIRKQKHKQKAGGPEA